DVDDTVAEPAGPPGASVVRLVGMEHDDLTRHAALDAPAIGEHLEPRLGDADRVGVVTMPGERAPVEPSPQQLDAARRPATAHPVPQAARTFKTLGGRSA